MLFWFCLFYLIGLGGGFKTSTQNFEILLIMQIYANWFKINEKCYMYFSISQRILILFVLSDRAWWGLQNFYTEFWQIYSKSTKNAHSGFWCFIWGLGASKLLHRIVKFINYANLCKFIQNQWKMPPLLYSEITTDLHLRQGRILRIA